MEEEVKGGSAAPLQPMAPIESDRVKELEADNERLRELASAAARLAEFGRFAAEQNHELRQPLLAIKGLAQLLLEKANPGPDDVHDSAKLIVEQADRMALLISELKHLSSPRRRGAGEGARTATGPILRRAAALLEYRIRKRATLVMDVPDNLPEVAVSGDQFEQIVINLMANAIDALTHGAGGGRAIIQVRARLRSLSSIDDRRVSVWVADNGAGVAPEARAHLFEAFFTTKGAEAGTGLGLAVSREISRGFGGDLELVEADDPAAGLWPHPVTTVFRLTLPVA